MRRFSILGLMGLVFALAVAFAALRGANEFWAGGFLAAVLGLIGWSILIAILGRGASRAAWLGFLVIGGGYFLAVRTLPAQDSAWLPTSQLLGYIEGQVIVPSAVTISFTPTGSLTTSATPILPLLTPISNGSTATNVSYWNIPPTINGAWAPIFPGAANGGAFPGRRAWSLRPARGVGRGGRFEADLRPACRSRRKREFSRGR